MMALIFLILVLAVLAAWLGKRVPALLLFSLTMLFAIVWFLHHTTSHLTIQL